MRRSSGTGTRREIAGALASLVVLPVLQAQEAAWLREFGSSSDDVASTVSVEDGGGCFVAGSTWAHWFPGGVDPWDIFLAKFDAEGSLLWGVQFGSTGDDWAYASTPDGAGGVFLAGETSGGFGGPYAGAIDAWYARCDAAGNRLWVRQIGTSGLDRALAVSNDGTGGVFVSGASDAPRGPYSWVTRCSASGDTVWFRPMFDETGIGALAPDGTGGFFGAGATTSSFGGPYMGGIDAWVGRFDAQGNLIWARQLGTPAYDWIQEGLAEDGQGGVLVAGETFGELAGPNAGSKDAWIAHYNGSGVRLAIRQLGTNLSDSAGSVARDGIGGVFLAGGTNGSLGAPSAGAADVWVAHLDASLDIKWINQFGSSVHDQSAGIAFAGPGAALVCGFTFGDLPGTGGGGGFDDAWLARYELCYADCNADGALTVADFGCFQTRFITADMYADCNANGNLTVQDFGCFQTKFVVGCP